MLQPAVTSAHWRTTSRSIRLPPVVVVVAVVTSFHRSRLCNLPPSLVQPLSPPPPTQSPSLTLGPPPTPTMLHPSLLRKPLLLQLQPHHLLLPPPWKNCLPPLRPFRYGVGARLHKEEAHVMETDASYCGTASGWWMLQQTHKLFVCKQNLGITIYNAKDRFPAVSGGPWTGDGTGRAGSPRSQPDRPRSDRRDL